MRGGRDAGGRCRPGCGRASSTGTSRGTSQGTPRPCAAGQAPEQSQQPSAAPWGPQGRGWGRWQPRACGGGVVPRCGALRTPAAPSQQRAPKERAKPWGAWGARPRAGGSRPAAAGAAGPPSGAPSRCAGDGAGAGWRPPRPSRTHPAPLRAAPPLRGGRPSAGPGGAGRGEGGGGSRGAPRPQRSPQDAAVEGRAPCPGPAGSPAPAGGGRRRDGEPRGSRRGAPKGEHKSRVRCGTAFPEDAASRVPHLGSQRMPHPKEAAWKRSHDRLQLRAERPGGAFPGFTLKWL